MSKYTTGELARLCGVSVRTVQYYDTRGILVPSETTDGGRRIYSEDDLRRMKIICFLRELDLPIESIKSLFEEENCDRVLTLLLNEQERALRLEIAEKQECVDRLSELRRTLKQMASSSVETVGDIAHIMENRKQLQKIRWIMLIFALPMNIIEITTVILWIRMGWWQPFVIGMCIVAMLGIWISWYYYRSVSYLCPSCHTVFKARFRDMFTARHTPTTRRLTCTHCKHRGFCIETCQKENKDVKN